MVRAALTAAFAALQATTGRTVIYTRGLNTATITAVPGQSVFEQIADQPELRQMARAADWLVAVADLVLDDEYVEPAEGDTLLDVDPTTGLNLTYTVCAPFGAPAWQYGNQHRAHYRIHTKLTATAPPT